MPGSGHLWQIRPSYCMVRIANMHADTYGSGYPSNPGLGSQAERSNTVQTRVHTRIWPPIWKGCCLVRENNSRVPSGHGFFFKKRAPPNIRTVCSYCSCGCVPLQVRTRWVAPRARWGLVARDCVWEERYVRKGVPYPAPSPQQPNYMQHQLKSRGVSARACVRGVGGWVGGG